MQAYRQLAKADPETHQPALAMALNKLSCSLAAARRGAEALAPDPGSRADLPRARRSRTRNPRPRPRLEPQQPLSALAQADRHADALTAIDEAVRIRRRLAEASADEHCPRSRLPSTTAPSDCAMSAGPQRHSTRSRKPYTSTGPWSPPTRTRTSPDSPAPSTTSPCSAPRSIASPTRSHQRSKPSGHTHDSPTTSEHTHADGLRDASALALAILDALDPTASPRPRNVVGRLLALRQSRPLSFGWPCDDGERTLLTLVWTRPSS